MTRPIIGITVDIENDGFISSPHAYFSSVEKAGGLPLVIPFYESDSAIDELVELCDGFLFSGGNDIAPERYGESPCEQCGEVAPLRDELEFKLLEKILKTEKPILAVCRGAQFINVAFGGTLIQDLPTQLPSSVSHLQTEPKFSHSHSVNVIEGTPLFDLVKKTRIPANSFHHQAIKTLADRLQVMATADDGVIEAVWHTEKRYIRAYQWHPERLFQIDENAQAIFKDFIKVCK